MPCRTVGVAWRNLPPRIKALYITTQTRMGGWLAEALAGDSAARVLLEEVVGSAAGMARLHDEVFDAVLVSHEPEELDALDLIEGYRTSGADKPLIVLGTQDEQEMAALCYEVGADGYVCVHSTTTRNLIWIVARAIQRHQLIRENQHLNHAEQTRLQREHDKSTRLIQEQRAIIEQSPPGDLCNAEDDCSQPQILPLPAELIAHYRELLRIYVIMGSGNLSGELRRLAKVLVAAGLTARQTIQLHLRSGGRVGPRAGRPQHPPPDDPGRPLVNGVYAAPGRGLPAAVSGADSLALATLCCRGLSLPGHPEADASGSPFSPPPPTFSDSHYFSAPWPFRIALC